MTRLKLDFDGKLPRDFAKRLDWIADTVPFTVARVERMRSHSGGQHVVVHVREQLPQVIVVALQALLGSDYKRETFNLIRVMWLSVTPRFWRARLNVLYDSKLQVRRKHG